MNILKIFNSKEKKETEKILNEEFGISEIPGKIIMRGKERLFLYSGSLNEKEIENFEKIVPVERIGVYFAKKDENNNNIRLSIEGSQMLKKEIKKNIFELDENQAEEWMKGRELQVRTGKKGFLIMKYKDNFLGSGKASEEKIGNFIPKNRRLKERN